MIGGLPVNQIREVASKLTYTITQTYIKDEAEYKPLYLADPEQLTWSGDENHAHKFTTRASAEEVFQKVCKNRNKDYQYMLTAASPLSLEWRFTCP
jgi:hypothetical protein